MYPSYKIVQSTKTQCYPVLNSINISETSARIDLQTMIDFTTERLITTQKDIILTLDSDNSKNLCLYSKWGFDGSSGHSSYKQAFLNPEADDAAVFITCFVPLRLMYKSKVIWQNPRPGSTRYCRPLKVEFIKESAVVSLAEKKRVDEEIKDLKMTEVRFQELTINVFHSLIFSMIDAKICNAITNTSSTQKCYICGATSKEFNSVDEMLKRQITVEYLDFGISVLHGWIRFLECLLHLAYKLPIQKWQARGSDKEKVAETKQYIQSQFKEKLGLIIDKPKPGFGNSNDGNTARRFFKNAVVSADITNLDLQLINKLHIILIVISSGHEINVEKFKKYAVNTAYYFVQKYPWYNMPPTLHKYLIHGPEIISKSLLPLGLLTEEAQEARNKDFKKFREHHSRKCSREKTMEDIFKFLILSSDPVITNKRKLPKKKINTLPTEATELLVLPTIETDDSDNDISNSETEDISDEN